MNAVQLPNADVFKQYLLTLLQEDTTFKYTLIDVLFKDVPFTVMKKHTHWTPNQKFALAKKHAINPNIIKGLQDLFKDEPPAQDIIETLQK